MNLHEYQAKELLKKYNVPVQDGFACGTVHEAEEAYRQIKTLYGSNFAVVRGEVRLLDWKTVHGEQPLLGQLAHGPKVAARGGDEDVEGVGHQAQKMVKLP